MAREINEIVNRIVTRAETVGFEQAAREFADLQRAQAGVARSTEDVARTSEKTDKQFSSLRRQIESLSRAYIHQYKELEGLERITNQLQAGVRQKLVTEQQAALIIANYSSKVLEAVKAEQALAQARREAAAASFREGIEDRVGIGQRSATDLGATYSALEERMRFDERDARQLRGALDPLGAAFAEMNAEVARYNELAARGVITSTELAQAVTIAKSRFDELALKSAEAFRRDFDAQLGVGRSAATDQGATFAALEERARADERAAKALRATVDPLGAAFAEMNAEVARYSDLAQRGVITTKELAQAVAIASAKYDEMAAKAAEAFRQDIDTRLGVSQRPATEQGATFSALEEQARSDERAARSLRSSIDPLGAAFADMNSEIARYTELAQRGVISSEELARATTLARTKFDDFASGGAAQAAAVALQKMESEAQALRAAIDPAGAAMARMNEEINRYRAMAAQGVISTKEMNAGISLARQRYDQFTAAVKTGSVRNEFQRTSQQLLQLSYQLNDMATMAATGANPAMILASQAGQIVQIFQNGEGSIGQQIAGMGRQAMAALTPMRLLTGGVLAFGVAAVAAYSDARAAQDQLAMSLEGLGERTGLTLYQLTQVSRAGAEAANISRSQGYQVGGIFASAGVAPSEATFQVAKNYARIFGLDVEAAAEELAKAFQDPAKGAEVLNEKLGFLDAKTLDYIKTLQRQNDITGAQSALLKALQQDLDDTATKTNAVGKAWEALGRFFSNAWTGFSEGVDRVVYGSPVEEQLAQARRELSELQRDRSNPVNQGAALIDADIKEKEALIATLERQIEAEKQLAAMEKERERITLLSGEARDAVRRVYPNMATRESLSEAQIDALAALQDPQIRNAMPVDEVHRLQNAYDALTRALNTLLDPQQKVAEQDRLAIAQVQARTVAEQMLVAAMQKRLDLAGQTVTPAEEARQIEAARELIRVRSTMQATEQLEAAQRSASIAGLDGYTRAMWELNERYKEQIRLAEGNAEAIKLLNQARDTEMITMTKEATLGPLLGGVGALNNQIRMMEVQRDTFGQSTAEVVAATTAQQIFNEYISQGVPITQSLELAVRTYAETAGQAAAAAEELAYRQREVIQIMDDTREFGEDSLGGMLKALSRGENPLKALADAGLRFGDKLIDNGLSLLMDQLMGKQGQPGSGPIGGPLQEFLNSLFGVKDVKVPEVMNPAQIASMVQITAGTVIVSGSLPFTGLPGMGGLGGAGSGGTAPLGPVERRMLEPLLNGTTGRSGGIGSDRLFPMIPPGPGRSGGIGSDALIPLLRSSGIGSDALMPLTSGMSHRQAFLDAIASVESPGYNVRFDGTPDGAIFDPMLGHPNIAAPIPWRPGLTSSAAGRYQFLYRTAVEQGYVPGTPFTPEVQDNLAWQYAQQMAAPVTGGDLEGYLMKFGFDAQLARQLAPTWEGLRTNPADALASWQQSMQMPFGQQQAGTMIPWANMGSMAGMGGLPQQFLGGLDQNLMQIVQGVSQIGGQFTGGFGGVLQGIVGSLAGAAGGAGGGGGGGLFGGIFSLLRGLGGLGGGMMNIGGFYLADGGYVSGPGGPRDDAIPARLSNGEFVINARATRQHRRMLEQINAGGPAEAASRTSIRRTTNHFGAPSITIVGASDPVKTGEEVDRRMKAWMKEMAKQQRRDDGDKWRFD